MSTRNGRGPREHPSLNPHGSVDETVRRGEELYRKLGEQLPNVAVLVFDRELRVLVALSQHEDLTKLKSLGVGIALDDFGTGYSSLARLRKFPVDVLKIDRMFIDELPENAAIADSVITLARNLGLRVIAEGVENPRQYAWLSERTDRATTALS
jgi:EAL domain-containing protein (putative c-di-GMP-specific phosphodiesterase class I)